MIDLADLAIILMLILLVVIYIVVVLNRKKQEKENINDEENFIKEQTEIEQLKKKHFLQMMNEKENKQIEAHLVDYSTYTLSVKEFILYTVLAGGLFFFIGQLFYESIIAAIIFASLGFFYPNMHKKTLLQRRKDQLNLQFKEAIASLSSSLAAGRSIENSFREVVADLHLLYPDPDTPIIREFEIINRRLENADTIENAILDFSIRSDIEDIQNFADVFITCKRSGGNLVEVIRRTSDIISEKIEIQQEVAVMLAQKRFESKIMSLAPLGMILLLKYSAGDYLSPMYQWNEGGPLIMTACLLVLGFAYWYGQRIMNIKV